jgi:deoxyribodipyrimidine photo-lyase
VAPDFALFDPAALDPVLARLPLDPLPRVTTVVGGTAAARARLRRFLDTGLAGYAADRSRPVPPQASRASGLSPYLHFGHLSIEEVVASVLDGRGDLDLARAGKREGFWGPDPDACAFLDEAVTWRDLGLHWHARRGGDAPPLEAALPAWAVATLRAHLRDPRPHRYDAEQLEAGLTADPLWNAAQKELVATGTMQGYLRMLWGKKVLEWSPRPTDAYRILVDLNNRYALDGRDPNSWTGILWCFGLFDRPWAPARPVLGNVRYMSSENTARKFRLGPYLDYVAGLPSIADVRAQR